MLILNTWNILADLTQQEIDSLDGQSAVVANVLADNTGLYEEVKIARFNKNIGFFVDQNGQNITNTESGGSLYFFIVPDLGFNIPVNIPIL
ncbi:hypothetical protein EBZ39_10425 [bacterium]|nr:hypothetical protein [bacterium]